MGNRGKNEKRTEIAICFRIQRIYCILMRANLIFCLASPKQQYIHIFYGPSFFFSCFVHVFPCQVHFLHFLSFHPLTILTIFSVASFFSVLFSDIGLPLSIIVDCTHFALACVLSFFVYRVFFFSTLFRYH